MFASSSFMPTQIAQWRPIQGHTVTGAVQLGMAQDVGVSPVTVTSGRTSSSIRTDKSASKTRADEVVGAVRLLVEADWPIGLGDQIIYAGQPYRVIGCHPRFDMDGQMNHLQVELDVWASP